MSAEPIIPSRPLPPKMGEDGFVFHSTDDQPAPSKEPPMPPVSMEPESMPTYMNDNHFVEKRNPLCEICIQCERDKTVWPQSALDRLEEVKAKNQEAADMKKQITELTAMVQQLLQRV